MGFLFPSHTLHQNARTVFLKTQMGEPLTIRWSPDSLIWQFRALYHLAPADWQFDWGIPSIFVVASGRRFLSFGKNLCTPQCIKQVNVGLLRLMCTYMGFSRSQPAQGFPCLSSPVLYPALYSASKHVSQRHMQTFLISLYALWACNPILKNKTKQNKTIGSFLLTFFPRGNEFHTLSTLCWHVLNDSTQILRCPTSDIKI